MASSHTVVVFRTCFFFLFFLTYICSAWTEIPSFHASALHLKSFHVFTETTGEKTEGSPGCVNSPRLLPLPEQSLPSCEHDPVTCLAAWGYIAPSLRASRVRRDSICAQGKVTFVDAIGSCRD